MSSVVERLRERSPRRRTAIAVAIVVAAVAAIVAYQASRGPGPTYAGSGPHPFATSNSGYGPKIALPASALATARTFVRAAVLREDPAASYDLVTPKLRGGMSRSAWATGNIPVTPFPKSALGQVKFQVNRSRARNILLQVEISSTTNSVQAAYDYLEMVPRGHRWLISYFAPVGYSPPIPAAQ